MVALSTTHAKYISLVERVKEAIWLRGIIMEWGITQECVKIYCDSKNVIYLTNNQVYHEKIKFIEIPFHFIREILLSWRRLWFIRWLQNRTYHICSPNHCLDQSSFIAWTLSSSLKSDLIFRERSNVVDG